MKLFFIIFAAVLAAGVVLLTGIYAKARLDQWEYALQMCYAETNSEPATIKARADAYMEQMRSVEVLNTAAVDEALKGHKRFLEMDQKIIALLENKPFGLPLTSAEQGALAYAKAANATLTKPAAAAAPAH
jgi:hypothetical protein